MDWLFYQIDKWDPETSSLFWCPPLFFHTLGKGGPLPDEASGIMFFLKALIHNKDGLLVFNITPSNKWSWSATQITKCFGYLGFTSIGLHGYLSLSIFLPCLEIWNAIHKITTYLLSNHTHWYGILIFIGTSYVKKVTNLEIYVDHLLSQLLLHSRSHCCYPWGRSCTASPRIGYLVQPPPSSPSHHQQSIPSKWRKDHMDSLRSCKRNFNLPGWKNQTAVWSSHWYSHC